MKTQSAMRIGLKEVRASFNQKIKGHYSVRWYGRPVANLLTPTFYNYGWTANGVTNFRIVISAIGVGLLVLPNWWGAIVACFIFYLCFALDCVDGNLARLRGAVTYWGKFVDGLADFVFVMGAPMAAGIGAYVLGEGEIWAIIGCLVTLMSLTSQMVRNRLSFFREWMIGQSGPLSESAAKSASASRKLQHFAASIYVNGTFLIPLLLLLPDHGRIVFVLAAVGLLAFPEIVWLVGTLWEARVILERRRQSIHSPAAALAESKPTTQPEDV